MLGKRMRIAFCHPDLGIGGALLPCVQGAYITALHRSVLWVNPNLLTSLMSTDAGAERLIVDAASELADHGNVVHIYTAHHNPQHCFEETLGGTFGVIVAGSWLPRHVLHRAHALCAYLRCLLAALRLAWTALWFPPPHPPTPPWGPPASTAALPTAYTGFCKLKQHLST